MYFVFCAGIPCTKNFKATPKANKETLIVRAQILYCVRRFIFSINGLETNRKKLIFINLLKRHIFTSISQRKANPRKNG